MKLGFIDWSIIAAYFLISLLIGVYYSRRAGKDVGEYFLSGRDLPWWLAGTSMVATTFAADTPLAVAGFVARNGVAGNWIWWNAALGSMLTVFFFARLWRRAGIMTDVEFAELRYAGTPAALLRGFRALYLGLPINCVIIGWVNLAMAKILAVTMGWNRLTAVLASLAITGFYSALSGLWGVVVTDFFQFVFAMGGRRLRGLPCACRRSAASTDCVVRFLRRRSSSCRASAPTRRRRRPVRRSRCRSRHSSRTSACSGGPAGIRDRSRAAAVTSRSA
jgi:solute:Na+ symporter, SSS family